MPDALSKINTKRTPQSQRADTRQVLNNAGGYTFKTGDAARIHRFLTLGTEGGTFYVREKELTAQNAELVMAYATQKPHELVTAAVEVSQAGRAPRNSPAIFALAAVASFADTPGRQHAFEALPDVVRTGYHLFQFAGYLENLRGWGKAARRAVSRWYLDRDAGQAAYQMLKYRQREGWAQRDILRSAHPFAREQHLHSGTPEHRQLFDWICGREADLAQLPLVDAFVQAQAATTVKQWVKLIAANKALTWEMLPDEALSHREVWVALLTNGMPQTALMRQLPKLTWLGVLKPGTAGTALVAAQLTNADRLHKARVHPINVLVALRTYASGTGARSSKTWAPVSQVTDALDEAFYLAFGGVEPSNVRTLLAVDVSGSMVAEVSGLPISCREAAMALALVTAATEARAVIVGFYSKGGRSRYGLGSNSWEDGISHLNISPKQRLDDVLTATANLPFGGTDCSLPFIWAEKGGYDFDHFQVITDNETWAGAQHPHQALKHYRNKTGIKARSSVVGMTATDFTIADPADPGMLDVAGFDAAVPNLTAAFARGEF